MVQPDDDLCREYGNILWCKQLLQNVLIQKKVLPENVRFRKQSDGSDNFGGEPTGVYKGIPWQSPGFGKTTKSLCRMSFKDVQGLDALDLTSVLVRYLSCGIITGVCIL